MDYWYKWPAELDEIVAFAEKHAPHANVYFSSYLYKAPVAVKDNVLLSRTIQADLDDADPRNIARPPTILVETSPGRHQGYWVMENQLSKEEHEDLSKRMTYSIPLCDRSGWALGRKVRIPGTLNHKYLSGPKEVRVVSTAIRTYPSEEFEALPEVPQFLLEHYDEKFLDAPVIVDEHPLRILERIKKDIPARIYIQYNSRQSDRSEALFGLMCWGFKAGLTRDEVFTLARGSANNKFADLQHRADQELAKDVLRAEHSVKSKEQDDRQVIQDLYRKPIPSYDKKRAIYAVVLTAMLQQGEFMTTEGGATWYVRRDIGRPIPITGASQAFYTLLDVQFGINSTEAEAKFIAHSLQAYTSSLANKSLEAALSYYDPSSNHILLHTGRKTVLRITADSVESGVDGSHGVLFPWYASVQPFTPSSRVEDVDWGEELFGNGTRGYGSSLHNLVNLEPHHAKALLKVWLMFVLFRNAASSRPIIAALGQPGSGKTTLFRKVYSLLYGQYKSLTGVTTMDDFDYATASDPLVVLDNVDSWANWLPDRIALAAGVSDVTKRKLYTDTDIITIRRQAILGVTAHNPSFGRADVADRFLLFTYKRLPHFVSETDVLEDLAKKRNQIWGAIVRDMQRVLRMPTSSVRDVPQFRVEDFARVGMWIAMAIGEEDAFRDALETVKSSQQSFTLEEEGFLVSAITKYVSTSGDHDKFYTSSQLWSFLEMCSGDANMFRILYKNASQLSRKLSTMQVALKKIIKIEQQNDLTGQRTWKLMRLEKDNNSDDNDAA